MKNRFFIYLALFFVVIVFLGPNLAPHHPFHYDLSQGFLTPSFQHWLGTDENGRDILSRILFGSRISMGIALVVVLVCSFLGTIICFLAGYFGGMVDRIFLMIADLFQAFPGILLAIAIAAFLPPSFLNVVVILCLVGWVGYARITRAQVLSLREKEFMEAGRALGLPLWRLFSFHVFPNLAGPLVVQATFGMAGVILIESTLSFLGLGVPATVPSLGRMMDSGSSLLLVAPHIALFPGLAIMLIILIFNLAGDQLRENI